MPKKEKFDTLIIIFDVGQTEDEEHDNGFFTQAKDSLSMIYQRKLLSDKKEDEIGLILTGGEIPVFVKYDLSQPKWDMVRFIEQELQPAQGKRNWLNGIKTAIKLLRSSISDTKLIVLFSDFSYQISDPEVTQIMENAKEMFITFTIIGPDCLSVVCSDEPAAKKSKLDEIQLQGVVLVDKMRKILEDKCQVCTLDQAVRFLSSFKSFKTTSKPRAWNCLLEIGPIQIAISGYLKIRQQQGKPSYEVTLNDNEKSDSNSGLTQTQDDGPKVSSSRNLTAIVTNVDTEEITKVPIESSDTITAFDYGCSIIPFSDADHMASKYLSGERGLCILGFTKLDSIPHGFLYDGTYVIAPRSGDENAEVALSALIQAMYELSIGGIARKVYARDLGMSIVLLTPLIEQTDTGFKECLLMHELPFKEDIRRLDDLQYKDIDLTKEQIQSVDELIDGMDLMTGDRGEDGEPCEAFDIFSLNDYKSQYFQYCVVQKILHPDQPLPDSLPKRLQSYYIPAMLRKSYQNSTKVLKEVFPLVKIDKADNKLFKQKNSANENVEPIIDVKPDPPKPPEQIVKKEDPEFITEIKTIFNEFGFPAGRALVKLLKMYLDSDARFAEILFDGILVIMKNLRDFALTNCPASYNKWLQEIRENCPTSGPIYEFFKSSGEKVGLITSIESKEVDVSPEAAANLFSDEGFVEDTLNEIPMMEEDDFLDDL